MGWIAQVADSLTQWWESAPTNKPFSPHHAYLSAETNNS